VNDITYSPILGSKGNIEFLALLSYSNNVVDTKKINLIVDQAHKILKE